MNRSHHRRIVFSLLPLAAAVLLVVACGTVPLTGRSQLQLVSSGQLNQLSADSYRQELDKATLSTDEAKVAQVRRVGERLATATEDYLKELGYSTSEYAWEFNLIADDKTVNAWCMPGGKVAVYTGILPYAQNETGLAVVMAHEIAHAVARHSAERMSQALLVQLGGASLSLAMREQPAATRDMYLNLYGLGSQVGVMLPYSRTHESEADRIGLILMARAGYDPREAVPFWGRMNEAGGARPPQFLSTHPAPDTRIRDLQAQLPEVIPIYEANKAKYESAAGG